MTEETEATHAQATSSSPEQTDDTEKSPPPCVVERYEPSAKNWAEIKPRILEMEKACFQDRTKTPPAFYGFEDDTLEKLFMNNDGTRHILLLKMGDIIVGWISARPLGFADHIQPLMKVEDETERKISDYYSDVMVDRQNPELPVQGMAYISHIAVLHDSDDSNHNPPRGAAAQIEGAMFQWLQEKGKTAVALDAVTITGGSAEKSGHERVCQPFGGYADKVYERYKKDIVLVFPHNVQKGDTPLPSRVHMVIRLGK